MSGGCSTTETCSGGMEWQECASACPLTCDNYNRPPVHCSLPCVEGCACPEGKVELDGMCVDPSACAGTFSHCRYFLLHDIILPVMVSIFPLMQM